MDVLPRYRVSPPNGSRLSCGRNAQQRKAAERRGRVVGEGTQFEALVRQLAFRGICIELCNHERPSNIASGIVGAEPENIESHGLPRLQLAGEKTCDLVLHR